MSRIPHRNLNEPLFKWCDELTRYYIDNQPLDISLMIRQVVYMSFSSGALEVLSNIDFLKEDYE